MPRKSRHPVKKKEEPAKAPRVRSKKEKEFKIPECKFRRNGVSYKKGDLVEIVHETGVYVGVLKSVLSSQLFVQSEDDPFGKFFFHRGLRIKKLKK